LWIGHLRSPNEITILETLSLKPKVFEIKNFLKPEESASIVKHSKTRVAKSDVALKDADKGITRGSYPALYLTHLFLAGKAATEWRTSSTYFLNANHFVEMQEVERRVQKMAKVPINQTEDAQVLRYNNGEHYHAHHDFFDPKDYANDPYWSKLAAGGARNRMATVFMYLSDVSQGSDPPIG